jgi:ferritin
MMVMDRIILEVDDQVAKNWRYSSEKKRQQVNNTINTLLQAAFKRKEDTDFIQFVKEVQDKAAERGLTEDILNDILNERN